MSYENVPKNLTEKAVLVRGGRPDYITLSSDPTPVPTADEAGAIWEHSDTGKRYRWSSTTWIFIVDGHDYYLEIEKGNILGHSSVHKFGRNPDIDTADGFETAWNGGGAYTGFNATAAEIVTVTSTDAADTSAGTGARTLEIFGLDTNWEEQSEIVTLNGTSLVDSVLSYIRLDKVIVRSAGTGLSNAGDISVAQKVTTANIFAVLPIGYNRTMICCYTIPAGKVGYFQSWGASLSGKTIANCNIRLSSRIFGEVFQVRQEVSIMGSGSSSFTRSYPTPKEGLPSRTDMYIEADTDQNNTGIAAFIDLLLVTDGF
jgi:hypothetical protein